MSITILILIGGGVLCLAGVAALAGVLIYAYTQEKKNR